MCSLLFYRHASRSRGTTGAVAVIRYRRTRWHKQTVSFCQADVEVSLIPDVGCNPRPNSVVLHLEGVPGNAHALEWEAQFVTDLSRLTV